MDGENRDLHNAGINTQQMYGENTNQKLNINTQNSDMSRGLNS